MKRVPLSHPLAIAGVVLASVCGVVFIRQAINFVRQNARDAGLACPAWPSKQVGVADFAAFEGIIQRSGDMFLADDFGQFL